MTLLTGVINNFQKKIKKTSIFFTQEGGGV